MARKGVFGKSLESAMRARAEAEAGQESDAPPAPAKRKPTSPTLSRALSSIENEDRQATRLIAPNLIAMSPVADRLDVGGTIADLTESIRAHGQKVPILVRRRDNGGLEVVYGRRRLLACRALGIDVRAVVADLSDEDAIIAQGLENTARLETSFIERALFVHHILAAGHPARVVQEAIGIDKSLISRMKAIVDAVPEDLIRTIGPAPGAGRRQWDVLRAWCESADKRAIQGLAKRIPEDLESTEKLAAAIAATRPEKPPAPRSRVISERIEAGRKGRKMTLSARSSEDAAFLSYLEERLPDLLEEWNAVNTPDDEGEV